MTFSNGSSFRSSSSSIGGFTSSTSSGFTSTACLLSAHEVAEKTSNTTKSRSFIRRELKIMTKLIMRKQDKFYGNCSRKNAKEFNTSKRK